jgi:hypothetical protein
MSRTPSARAVLEAAFQTPVTQHEAMVLWGSGKRAHSSSATLHELHEGVHHLVNASRRAVENGSLTFEHRGNRWHGAATNGKPHSKVA